VRAVIEREEIDVGLAKDLKLWKSAKLLGDVNSAVYAEAVRVCFLIWHGPSAN